MERNLETLYLLGQFILAHPLPRYTPDWYLLAYGIGYILDSENIKES